MGWEKVACWRRKAAISLKRVKIQEKLLWRAYRKSQTLFRTVPSPIPYAVKMHYSVLPRVAFTLQYVIAICCVMFSLVLVLVLRVRVLVLN